jgi:hypothetical protein
MDRLSTLKPVLDVKADRIFDEVEGFLLGIALRIATLQRRNYRDETAVLVALEHNSKLVHFHVITSVTGLLKYNSPTALYSTAC